MYPVRAFLLCHPCGCKPYHWYWRNRCSDFQRATEAAHGMTFEMAQHNHEIVIEQILAYDIFLRRWEPAGTGMEVSKFIHDVNSADGVETMIFDSLAMVGRLLT